MKELVIDLKNTFLYSIKSNIEDIELNLDNIRNFIKTLEEIKNDTNKNIVTLKNTNETLYQIGTYAKYPILTDINPDNYFLKIDELIYKEDKDKIIFLRYERSDSSVYIKDKKNNKTYLLNNQYSNRLNISCGKNSYNLIVNEEHTDISNYRNVNDKISNRVSNNEKDGIVHSITRYIDNDNKKETFSIELKNSPFASFVIQDDQIISIRTKATSFIFLKRYLTNETIESYKEKFLEVDYPDIKEFQPFLDDLKTYYEIEMLSKDKTSMKYKTIEEILEGCKSKIKEEYNRLFLLPEDLELYYYQLKDSITFKEQLSSVKNEKNPDLILYELKTSNQNDFNFDNLEPEKLSTLFNYIDKIFKDKKIKQKNKIK